MKACDTCGKLGRFKRPECSQCYWETNRPPRAISAERKAQMAAYARDRYYARKAERRAL